MFVAESKQRFMELEIEYFGGSDVANKLYVHCAVIQNRKNVRITRILQSGWGIKLGMLY